MSTSNVLIADAASTAGPDGAVDPTRYPKVDRFDDPELGGMVWLPVLAKERKLHPATLRKMLYQGKLPFRKRLIEGRGGAPRTYVQEAAVPKVTYYPAVDRFDDPEFGTMVWIQVLIEQGTWSETHLFRMVDQGKLPIRRRPIEGHQGPPRVYVQEAAVLKLKRYPPLDWFDHPPLGRIVWLPVLAEELGLNASELYQKAESGTIPSIPLPIEGHQGPPRIYVQHKAALKLCKNCPNVPWKGNADKIIYAGVNWTWVGAEELRILAAESALNTWYKRGKIQGQRLRINGGRRRLYFDDDELDRVRREKKAAKQDPPADGPMLTEAQIKREFGLGKTYISSHSDPQPRHGNRKKEPTPDPVLGRLIHADWHKSASNKKTARCSRKDLVERERKLGATKQEGPSRNPDDLLDVGQTAAVLGCTTDNVYRMIYTGTLKPEKLPSLDAAGRTRKEKYHFRRRAVEAMQPKEFPSGEPEITHLGDPHVPQKEALELAGITTKKEKYLFLKYRNKPCPEWGGLTIHAERKPIRLRGRALGKKGRWMYRKIDCENVGRYKRGLPILPERPATPPDSTKAPNGAQALALSSTTPVIVVPDGPRPPNLLYHDGEAHRVPPIPWRLLDFLWGQPNRTASVDDVMEHVWQDDSAKESALKMAQSKANVALLDAGFRCSISTKNGRIALT